MYKIVFSNEFKKQLKKLDVQVEKVILNYIDTKLNNCIDPFSFGKPLVSNLNKLWRYRIGKYRIIAQINKNELIIFLLEVDKRDSIYK